VALGHAQRDDEPAFVARPRIHRAEQAEVGAAEAEGLEACGHRASSAVASPAFAGWELDSGMARIYTAAGRR